MTDWSQGTPLAYVRELCRYWLQEYEWPAAQARLNRFPQFLTRINDLDIHFVHVRSPHPGATPLVMTHGWPGSVVEFRKVIEPLTDPVAFGGSRRRRVPRGLPDAARLRVQRQADPARGGASSGSPTPGTSSWPASATRATAPRAATGDRW